jgi:hypothetical protein
MKRPAVIHRKAPAPLSRERGACHTVPGNTVPGCTVSGCIVPGRQAAGATAGALADHGTRPLAERCPQGGAAPRGGVPQGRYRLAAQLPELVFAAVRPGFVAACMVNAAAARDGRRVGWIAREHGNREHGNREHGNVGGGAGNEARRSRQPVEARRASPLPRSRCAQASPVAGARTEGALLFKYEALRYRTGCRQNRQKAYFARQEAGLRGGVRRDTAIIPRDRGDARDLRLATLRNDSCV